MALTIAEIGCNHRGDFPTALAMILQAKFCGAWCAKFQKREPKECLTPEQYAAPHPNPANSYGETYGEHREALELTIAQHSELKRFAESIGVVYSTSVWDLTSTLGIIKLNPKFIKIPSACNHKFEMMEVLRCHYSGEIHLSVGMTTPEEIASIRDFWRGNLDRLVVYACTSGYPVPPEKTYLLEIPKLRGLGFRVGFSGHHVTTDIDCAAVALGVEFIERHFTLDRSLKGTDHAASLDVQGLSGLTQAIRNVKAALSEKPRIMDVIETEQRTKLKGF